MQAPPRAAEAVGAVVAAVWCSCAYRGWGCTTCRQVLPGCAACRRSAWLATIWRGVDASSWGCWYH